MLKYYIKILKKLFNIDKILSNVEDGFQIMIFIKIEVDSINNSYVWKDLSTIK